MAGPPACTKRKLHWARPGGGSCRRGAVRGQQAGAGLQHLERRREERRARSGARAPAVRCVRPTRPCRRANLPLSAAARYSWPPSPNRAGAAQVLKLNSAFFLVILDLSRPGRPGRGGARGGPAIPSRRGLQKPSGPGSRPQRSASLGPPSLTAASAPQSSGRTPSLGADGGGRWGVGVHWSPSLPRRTRPNPLRGPQPPAGASRRRRDHGR